MKYSYTGVTPKMDRVNGTIDAQDESDARARLRAMRVRPLKLTPQAGALGREIRLPSLSKVIDLKGMLVFTRQFSALVDAGVPVVQGLGMLAAQEKRPKFKSVLEKVKEDIEAGSTLAEGLDKHPSIFSDFFVRLVEAGEISGTLDKTLKRLGIQLEKLDRIRAKVKAAMIYPVITLVVAVGVLVFLLVKVIPEISKLYKESNAQLPELTQMVLKLSSWVQTNYTLMIGGIVGGVIGFMMLYRLPSFRVHWDPFFLKLPLIGDLTIKAAVARFTRTMSTLLSSGVPLLNGFDICGKLVGNFAVRNSLVKAAAAVTEGKTIGTSLAASKIFPPMVVSMVAIGESTGKLDELLGKIADMYEDEVDDAVSNLTGLIQPVLIVVVGGIVAFLLIAMYLPIFQLAEKATTNV